jgi:hypothetical protein
MKREGSRELAEECLAPVYSNDPQTGIPQLSIRDEDQAGGTLG